jgi:ABC-2 type transport system ATP-binding protein
MPTQSISDRVRSQSPPGRSPGPAIRARGVRKAFGHHVVLDGVDLSVDQGSVFALLGPNGAGKTTMVNILATLLPPDEGEILVGGHDLATDPTGVRHAIGVTGQFSAVDGLLTGEENLQLMICATSVAPRAGGGWASSSNVSASSTRPASRCPPIRAA